MMMMNYAYVNKKRVNIHVDLDHVQNILYSCESVTTGYTAPRMWCTCYEISGILYYIPDRKQRLLKCLY